MIYQYIYGRGERGYGEIFSNDHGKYFKDSYIQHAVDIQIDPPKNCAVSEAPEIITYMNSPGGRPVSIIGRSKLLFGLRDSKLDHFYLYSGKDRTSMEQNIDLLFCKRAYVDSIEEAEAYTAKESDSYSSLEVPTDLLSRLHIEDELFAELIAAALDASANNSEIYIIRSSNTQANVQENLQLLYKLFSFLPKIRVTKLGFITYYKLIVPHASMMLDSSINIRFTEDSEENKAEYKAKEKKGHFIFDLESGYFTQHEKKDYISSFLAFLKDSFTDQRLLKEFYNFFEEAFTDSDIIKFKHIAILYHYWRKRKAGSTIDFKTLLPILDLYDLLNEHYQQEFDSLVQNEMVLQHTKYREDSESTDQKEFDYFLLRVYRLNKHLAALVTPFYAAAINHESTESSSSRPLRILQNENASDAFIHDLRRLLLEDSSFINGGELLLKESLRLIVIQWTEGLDRILKNISLFSQFASISVNIFDHIDQTLYCERYFKASTEAIDIDQLDICLKKIKDTFALTEAKSVESFYFRIYDYICEVFFDRVKAQLNCIRPSRDEDFNRIIEALFDFFECSFKNKPNAADRPFQFDFMSYLRQCNLKFNSGDDSSKLYNGAYFIKQKAETLIKKYPQAAFLNSTVDEIVQTAFKDQLDFSPEQLAEFDKWPEAYIKLTRNNHLIQLIEDRKKRAELETILLANNWPGLKLYLQDHMENNPDSDFNRFVFETVKLQLSSLPDQGLLSLVNSADYEVVPLLFRNNIKEMFDILPRDSIQPWVQCLRYLKTEFKMQNQNQHAQYIAKLKNIFVENKKLAAQALKLSESDKVLLGMNDHHEGKHAESRKPLFEVAVLAVWVLSFCALRIWNGLSHTHSTLRTSIFNFIVAALVGVGAFLFFRMLKQDRSSKSSSRIVIAELLFLVSVISLGINVYVFSEAKFNSDQSFINFYKDLYGIHNDFSPPVFKIQAAQEVMSPDQVRNLNTKIWNTSSLETIKNESDLYLKISITDNAIEEGLEVLAVFEAEEGGNCFSFQEAEFNSASDSYPDSDSNSESAAGTKAKTETKVYTLSIAASDIPLGESKLTISVTDLAGNTADRYIQINREKPALILPTISSFAIMTEKMTLEGGKTSNYYANDAKLTIYANETVSVTVTAECAEELAFTLTLNNELLEVSQANVENNIHQVTYIFDPGAIVGKDNQLVVSAKAGELEQQLTLVIDILD